MSLITANRTDEPVRLITANGKIVGIAGGSTTAVENAVEELAQYANTQIASAGAIAEPKLSIDYLELRGFENAVGSLPIEVPPAGENQPIHPKVLYIPGGFGGHVLWMAYTPYPYQDGQQENPCIVYSDNGIDWFAPDGVENPLDWPDSGYNSDAHLLYREDTGVMEIWWREAIGTTTETIFRRTSTDGTTWTEAEQIFQSVSDSITSLLSPCATYDTERAVYKIWVGTGSGSGKYANYYESADGTAWELKSATNLAGWHFDIIESDLGYEAIIAPGTGSKYLEYATSADGITWTDPVTIMRSTYDGFDKDRIYRSSFIKVDGYYYLYYTGVSNNVWTIGLSVSTEKDNIASIRGYVGGSVVTDNVLVELVENLNDALDGESSEKTEIELTDPVYSISDVDMKNASGVYNTGVCPFADDEDFTVCLDCTSQDTAAVSGYNVYYESGMDGTVAYIRVASSAIASAGTTKTYANAISFGDNFKQIISHKKGNSNISITNKITTSGGTVKEETLTCPFVSKNLNAVQLNAGHMLINSFVYYDRQLTDSEKSEFMS